MSLSSTLLPSSMIISSLQDKIFLELCDKYGKNWKDLAEEFNRVTKTAYEYTGDQCSGRYRSLNLNCKRWSQEVTPTKSLRMLLKFCILLLRLLFRKIRNSLSLLSDKNVSPKTSALIELPLNFLIEIKRNVAIDTTATWIRPWITHHLEARRFEQSSG
jgi:hypothetical protein